MELKNHTHASTRADTVALKKKWLLTHTCTPKTACRDYSIRWLQLCQTVCRSVSDASHCSVLLELRLSELQPALTKDLRENDEWGVRGTLNGAPWQRTHKGLWEPRERFGRIPRYSFRRVFLFKWTAKRKEQQTNELWITVQAEEEIQLTDYSCFQIARKCYLQCCSQREFFFLQSCQPPQKVFYMNRTLHYFDMYCFWNVGFGSRTERGREEIGDWHVGG